MTLPAPPKQFRLTGVHARSLAIGSMEIPARGAVAVQGPNGAGKSTLLQVLGLLLKPHAGTVEFGSIDAWASTYDQTAMRRQMTLVMQDPYLFSGSVRENLAYGGGDAAELDRWGLAALADKPAKALSGGESKRLALARALALKREILMLDEPHEGLDAGGRATLNDMLEKRTHGARLMVLATHDTALAHRVCDEVLYLRDGHRSDVAPDNLFKGRVDGTTFLSHWGASFEVAERRDGPAVAAIDPADVLLSSAPLTSSARNSFESRVVALESLTETLVRVRVKARNLELVAHVTQHSARDLNLKPGDAVYATFKAASVKLT